MITVEAEEKGGLLDHLELQEIEVLKNLNNMKEVVLPSQLWQTTAMVSVDLIKQAVYKAVFTVRQKSWQDMRHWNYIIHVLHAPNYIWMCDFQLLFVKTLSISLNSDTYCYFQNYLFLLKSVISQARSKLQGSQSLGFKRLEIS